MKIDFIVTIDFTYHDIEILNCKNIKELKRKVNKGQIIDVLNSGQEEHINSDYIIFFGKEI